MYYWYYCSQRIAHSVNSVLSKDHLLSLGLNCVSDSIDEREGCDGCGKFVSIEEINFPNPQQGDTQLSLLSGLFQCQAKWCDKEH